jgi:Tat protein translocase TatB subunit
MFGLSFFEILFLAALALIVIGPKQLPEVARTLGRFMNELRRTTNMMTEQMKQSVMTPPPHPVQTPYPANSGEPQLQNQIVQNPVVAKKEDSGNVR